MKQIFTLRRGNIAAALLMFLLVCLICTNRAALPAAGEYTHVVVIDAGHGAPDGGAVGKSGVPESDINLAVSEFLHDELLQNGYTVIMTRTDENGIFKNDDDSIRNKKRADLKERARIANESGADLFISVHMNYFGIEKYSGPQVFYSAASEDGEKAAKCMRESFLKNIGDHCTREVKPVTDGIYLLREVKTPAVLVECGFLSNAEEEQLLISPEYQKKMAHAIAVGVDSYFAAGT